MDGMIRRLQRRFIVIATFAVVILLTISLGMVNFVNFRRARREIDSTLNVLLAHEGIFPENPEDIDDNGLYDDSAEAYYQTRYFSARISDDGVQTLDLRHIAAVSEKDARTMTEKVSRKGHSQGRLLSGNAVYAYKMKKTDGGDTLLVVLNCTRNLMTANIFLQNSICLGVVLTLLYICILTIISRRAIEPMRRNAESQKQFITNAGHELKTPLAIISANAEVLEMLNGRNEWTESILNQTRRGTQLVDRLIVMAKAGEREELVLTEVDLSAVTEEAALSFRSVAEKDAKTLSCEIEKDIHVLGEERMLREIVNILTDNAVKYCDPAGRITVQLTRSKGTVRLTVTNSYAEGAGVDCSRFFERFYRADSSHSRNAAASGYGIGLSMAQDLTAALKGRISASCNAKKGEISFIVQLPEKSL